MAQSGRMKNSFEQWRDCDDLKGVYREDTFDDIKEKSKTENTFSILR
jgi:hypothetical protein